MLQTLMFVFLFLAVASMWIPNSLKNQFMKQHDRTITKILSIITLILGLCYFFV